MKVLWMLLAALCFAGAFEPVRFTETRYLKALDMERVLEGEVRIEASGIRILYTRPQEQNLTRLGSKLLIVTQKKHEEIALEQNPHLALFFDLLIMLFQNDTHLLIERFNIEEKQGSVALTPKTTVGTLEGITLWPNLKQVEHFELKMLNGDRITIRKRNALH